MDGRMHAIYKGHGSRTSTPTASLSSTEVSRVCDEFLRRLRLDMEERMHAAQQLR